MVIAGAQSAFFNNKTVHSCLYCNLIISVALMLSFETNTDNWFSRTKIIVIMANTDVPKNLNCILYKDTQRLSCLHYQ